MLRAPSLASAVGIGDPSLQSDFVDLVMGCSSKNRITCFGIFQNGFYGNRVTKSVFTRKHDQFRRMLVAARKRARLTQVELAHRLSRPQSFVSKMERGERRLDVVEFLEVADALAIDPTTFIEHLRRPASASSKR